MEYSEENNDQKTLLNQMEVDKEISNSNLKITQCANILANPKQLKSNSGFFYY